MRRNLLETTINEERIGAIVNAPLLWSSEGSQFVVATPISYASHRTL